MKNTQSTIFANCLLAVMLFSFAFFTACQKDTSSTTVSLVGKWYKSYGANCQIYTFNSDNSVILDQVKVDTVTRQILGYYTEASGQYTTNQDSLKMSNLTYKTNPQSIYGPFSALVAATGVSVQAYRISINAQQNLLSVYFTCPINANCLPSPIVYIKE